MSPRKYSMDKRKAAVEETRQRILEATLALHAEKGIFGTSWQDIAKRADVSVATLKRDAKALRSDPRARGGPCCARSGRRTSENRRYIFVAP